MTWVPVLEIGGTHVAAARVRAQDWSIDRKSMRRRSLDARAGAEELLAALADTASAASAASAGGASGGDAPHCGRWGVAIPGPFDYGCGVAWFRDVGKFDSLYGVEVAAALRRSIEPAPVEMRFINDADAFALGEWIAGAIAGCSRAAAITLGTGIGSGFIADGALIHSGPGVPPGGRANELVVDGAPLEAAVSRRAIRTAYAASTGDAAADVAQIARRASAGEPAARTVLSRAFRLLGRTIGPLLEQFAAQRLVIGGSMAGSWELLEPWFLDGWRAAGSAAIPIAVSRRGDGAPLIGAAAWALR